MAGFFLSLRRMIRSAPLFPSGNEIQKSPIAVRPVRQGGPHPGLRRCVHALLGPSPVRRGPGPKLERCSRLLLGKVQGRQRGSRKHRVPMLHDEELRHGAFRGLGEVFDNAADFGEAFFKDYHPEYGAGIRLKIPPQIILRVDRGMGPGQDNLYFTIGESF